MTYYKVICDNAFAGVGTTNDLRKHQKKHNILVFAGSEDAECIEIDGELYRDKWCKPFSAGDFPCKSASVLAISLEEYESLKSSIDRAEEIRIDEAEPISDEITETAESDAEEVTAEFVRNVKIQELSLACSKAIADGFDVEISGEVMHFSLTTNDQTNLNAAAMQGLNGASLIPYHSDGGEYRLFALDDILKIVNSANEHRTYHLAYFNSLKKWVNTLVRISSIQSVEYGSEIPKKYQSPLLKSMIEGGDR